jgi:hypothetical protein
VRTVLEAVAYTLIGFFLLMGVVGTLVLKPVKHKILCLVMLFMGIFAWKLISGGAV